jgi:hypothetical protein
MTIQDVDSPENRNAQPEPDVVAQRRALCEACEHKKPVGLCGKCLCIIHLKTKWKDQKCPIGKW